MSAAHVHNHAGDCVAWLGYVHVEPARPPLAARLACTICDWHLPFVTPLTELLIDTATAHDRTHRSRPNPLDYCPSCGRRIYDFEPGGCELATGQRWCTDHVSAPAWEAAEAFARDADSWAFRHRECGPDCCITGDLCEDDKSPGHPGARP